MLPASALAGASRRETTRKIEQYIETAQRDAQTPMWKRLRSGTASSKLTEQWRGPIGQYRNYLLTTAWPSIDFVAMVRDENLAIHEATMTGIALSLWRERHGDWPATLEQLTPDLLPAVPVDHSSGKPLCYRLRDGAPVLYGVGKDGKDDGGTLICDKDRWPEVPEKGDWVLYPPVRPI